MGRLQTKPKRRAAARSLGAGGPMIVGRAQFRFRRKARESLAGAGRAPGSLGGALWSPAPGRSSPNAEPSSAKSLLGGRGRMAVLIPGWPLLYPDP